MIGCTRKAVQCREEYVCTQGLRITKKACDIDNLYDSNPSTPYMIISLLHSSHVVTSETDHKLPKKGPT